MPNPQFPLAKYSIIYADLPWDYGGQSQYTTDESTGSANSHYPTMTLDELRKLSIEDIAAKDCLLFMWSSSPHLDQAIRLGKSWGFDWATVAFIWHKQKPNPGFYTMSECELCLVFKKGKIPEPRGSRSEEQFLSYPRSEHSRKPEEIRHRIERMFPNHKKIELFARGKSLGWDCWGNETETKNIPPEQFAML